MTFHSWFLFGLAYLATTISPGPNVLLVIRNTVRYGSRGTVATISGNLVTQAIVVVLVALGVGTLLRELPPLFVAMKVVGAAYLIYLGIKQLRSKPTKVDQTAGANMVSNFSRGKVFREAFLVSGSNPKTMIFLSAFMPQFVTSDHPIALQFLIMYITIAVIVASVHAIYSVGVRRLQTGLGASSWLQSIKRCSGFIFIGLGLKLLTAKIS